MKMFFIPLLTAMLLAPVVLAHDPAGTPDRFCTGPNREHDYVGAVYWRFRFGPVGIASKFYPQLDDGNLEECGYSPLVGDNQACRLNPLLVGVCALDRTADWDRELEFGVGGAVLAAQDPASTFCWDIPAHHGSNPTVYVQDVVPQQVAFWVMADWARPEVAFAAPCGDHIYEACDPTDPAEEPGVTCNPQDQGVGAPAQVAGPVGSVLPTAPTNSVQVPFGPGQDGTYVVLVEGFAGHIWT